VLHRDAQGNLEDHARAGSASGAVARGSDGSLYLGQAGRVVRVAPSGETSVAARDVGDVYGIAVGAEDRLYVADWSGGRVLVVVGGKARVLAEGLEYPSGLVLDGAGDLFVKESGRQTHQPMRIRKITPDGTVTELATIDPSVRPDARLRTATFALG